MKKYQCSNRLKKNKLRNITDMLEFLSKFRKYK